MSERTEDPIIFMGRDQFHYFEPVSALRRDATRYVRGDLVDAVVAALEAQTACTKRLAAALGIGERDVADLTEQSRLAIRASEGSGIK